VGPQSPWYSRRALLSILSNIHSALENIIYLVIRPLCTASKNLNTVIVVEIEKQGGRIGFGFYVAETIKVWVSEHRSYRRVHNESEVKETHALNTRNQIRN